jgi:hypothetical protein
LDFRALRKATEMATNFDFLFEIKEEELDFETEQASFKTILEEWADYTQERNLDNKIVSLGAGYIKEAEE